MAIRKIDAEKCVGCRQCIVSCPADVIRFDEETKKAVVRYGEDCRICMWCVTVCKQDAIDMKKTETPEFFPCWG